MKQFKYLFNRIYPLQLSSYTATPRHIGIHTLWPEIFTFLEFNEPTPRVQLSDSHICCSERNLIPLDVIQPSRAWRKQLFCVMMPT